MSAEPSSAERRRLAPWFVRASALVIFCVPVGAAYLFGLQRGEEPDAPHAELLVSQTDLNFGEQWETATFVWDLPLTNPTSQEIKIQQFFSSCTCQKVEPASLVVPPGGRARVYLTLDLTHYGSDQEATHVRDFAVQLFPVIENFPPQPAWTIRGKVRVALHAVPREVDFGTVSAGRAFPPQIVKLTAHMPIANLVPKPNPWLSAEIDHSQDCPERYQLKITPRGEIPVGRFSTEIVLEPTGLHGKSLPPLRIPARGLVLEDIQAEPGMLVFGARPVGQVATATVVLQSASNSPFEVVGVKCESPDVTVVSLGDDVTLPNAFRVTQRTSKSGRQDTSIRFVIRTMKKQQLVVIVPGTYHGIGAAATPKIPPTTTGE